MVEVEAYINGEWHARRLENVQFVPMARMNLFATGKLTEKGFSVSFREKFCEIFDGETGDLAAVGHKDAKNLYRMFFRQAGNEHGNICIDDSTSLQQWHRRLGHINVATIKSMCKKGLVSGINFTNEKEFFCEECHVGKMHRSSHPLSETRSLIKGECIHVDLCGPMEQTGIGGARYFMLLKDEATSFRFVYNIGQKSEVEEKLRDFLAFVENTLETRIKSIRCDNGREFIANDVMKLLSKHGIRLERIAPYTPEQNGFIERDNRTVQESARTMLIASGLSKSLWPEAVRTAVYILNRSTNSRCNDKTPYECWFDSKPTLSHLKVFGTVGYAFVPKQNGRKKWDPKAKKVHLVGYEPTNKNFRLYDPETRKVFISCDVKFNEIFIEKKVLLFSDEDDDDNIDENSTRKDGSGESSSKQQGNVGESSDKSKASTSGNTSHSTDNQDSVKDQQNAENAAQVGDPAAAGAKNSEIPNRRGGLRSNPQQTKFFSFDEFGGSAIFNEPMTYTEAMTSGDSSKWKNAIKDELKSLKANETWEFVDKPKNRKVIGCKWVFKVKTSNNKHRYKARLVAKGYSQQAGIDYTETFSPVVRYDSVRTMMAIAAVFDMEMTQFDVKTAFLNGELQEEIYMQVPEGVECENGQVCRLKKSLYGLKQASRAWNSKFVNLMKACDLNQSKADPCVFHGVISSKKVIILLYVDDGLIIAEDQRSIDNMLKKLSDEFSITLGMNNYYVGMEIHRD